MNTEPLNNHPGSDYGAAGLSNLGQRTQIDFWGEDKDFYVGIGWQVAGVQSRKEGRSTRC